MLPPIEFKGLRSNPVYPATLETLGDHIRTVRLNRQQYQKDAAAAIGVSVESIIHWELGQTKVMIRHYPQIMAYLGYCPVPGRDGTPSLGELVRLHRIHRGLSLGLKPPARVGSILGRSAGGSRTCGGCSSKSKNSAIQRTRATRQPDLDRHPSQTPESERFGHAYR